MHALFWNRSLLKYESKCLVASIDFNKKNQNDLLYMFQILIL